MAIRYLTLVLAACAAFANGEDYTVWASVVVNRMGDRTPEVLGTLPYQLTSLGAQQSYTTGSFFRNRYLATSGDGRIFGMDPNIPDADQLYVQALGQQTSAASAQAFLQGLYPPFTLNSTAAATLDPTSISSNGSYVTSPLGGYQYPELRISGGADYDFIYISANLDCPAFDTTAAALLNDPGFKAMQAKSKGVYQTMWPFLQGVMNQDGLDFANAYAIYDYISYQAAHDHNVSQLLQQPQWIDPNTNQSYLYTLKWLADAQQQFQLANQSAYNSLTKSTMLPEETAGSISTIAGNFLAARILLQLASNIESQGEYFKLSLLFADFEPLVSLFSLMNMSHASSNFTGLPDYASSAVFELYSWTNTTVGAFPPIDSLYVNFYFRNGSNDQSRFLQYSTFHRDPDQLMSWSDFYTQMNNVALGDIGAWCTQCGATNMFCSAWNTTLASIWSGNGIPSTSGSTHSALSPAAAGAVGAIVALAFAGLVFALVMLIGGVRFHRVQRRKTGEMGGFKGSDKMASDRDLTLPKNGVVVDSTVADDEHAPGHERTGSWEMKDAEAGKKTSYPVRSSFDHDDDLRIDPFADPVRPREGV